MSVGRKLLGLASLALVACGPSGVGDGELATGLSDPGFEGGGEAWAHLDEERLELFSTTTAQARGGSRSGWLALDSSGLPPSMRTRGATAAQDLRPPVFPERISGFYRVGRWQRPDDAMGLTVRVLVYAVGDPRTLEILRPDGPNPGPAPFNMDSYGIAYRLAGREAASAAHSAVDPGWANLDFLDAGPEEPTRDRWIPFDLPLRADFERVWGVAPEGYGRLRVLLQVLWLDRTPGGEVLADVYFDDLELHGARP